MFLAPGIFSNEDYATRMGEGVHQIASITREFHQDVDTNPIYHGWTSFLLLGDLVLTVG